MATLIKLYEDNPNERAVQQVVECLQDGGIVISPTDTVYGIGCDIYNQKAFEKLCHLTGKKKEKSNFSFICYDLSHLSEFAKPLDNSVFKLMKSVLPGPYTFVLEANNQVPKFIQKKKTVGIRVPDNNIIRTIVQKLGHPIMNASIKNHDDVLEYITDPELIYEHYKDLVDIVIDGGYGDYTPSTVINCTDGIELVREGKGVVDFL
ncbi:MAG: threonylcarbamoyl-AMP synthase [Bacteroidales bacterium]|nr:threonylcarbamoyl-AMP synthase [Bacteroidales bacterium]MBQ4478785.1 threonylcarbamoyl-AMP synthase [Bacteroidales bacterium]MBR4453482.1 threonylcarbamoyl-AMP synthase [Bacteroidales bacterium]MCR5554059.1 threonylcarbamoyl-AMP synthase [Bacteroidales bacterium]